LGLGFVAGQHQGLLLAIALAVEFLFLALSIASVFEKGVSRLLVLGITMGVSAMVPIGSLLAGPISNTSPSFQTAAYAFGLIALLYLALEELTIEAHATEDTPMVTTMFFVGFIALTVLNEALG
jgi:zinc transporter, ZIP family